MRKLLLLLSTVVALSATAQDTLKVKKDTVRVPVFISEQIDTVQVPYILYEHRGFVKVSRPGYLIRKGAAMTNQPGKPWRWIKEPQVVGTLDNKKRSVQPVIN